MVLGIVEMLLLIRHINAVQIPNHFSFQDSPYQTCNSLQCLEILITFTCTVITLQHMTTTTVTVEGTLSVDTLMFTLTIGYGTLINI